MADHVLFKNTAGRDVSSLPAPFNTWKNRLTNEPSARSSMNTSGSYSTLYRYITNAIINYVMGPSADVALVEVGRGHYATESTLSDGTTILTRITTNGKASGAHIQATGRHVQLDPLGDASNTFDHTPYFLMLLPVLADALPEVKDALSIITQEYAATGDWNMNAIYLVNDAMYYGLTTEAIKCLIPGGAVNLLTDDVVKTGALSGTVVCGSPRLLLGASGVARSKNKVMTFKEAKIEFQHWSSAQEWTEEEKRLIPVFPDDYPVLPEALKFARLFVRTRDDQRPMSNFLWRGITSYGKSKGVELMAAFLNMPLLRVTCHATMETQNFLSEFVPDNSNAHAGAQLPSFESIALDPISAYKELTGLDDENATPQACMDAYAAAAAAQNTGGARFKHVESNFIKALSKGYIVEVQEISRIKDPGVLVGLNDYDTPNSVIPLVDGSQTRRHPNAMVVYSDNVGYVSCRPVDPSVIRRMAYVIDSYELSKADVIARVVYNTGFTDRPLLEKLYEVWNQVAIFCKEREITDGSISVTELEMWAQAIQADNMDKNTVYENCQNCLISKATSDIDEQKAIIASVLNVYLSDYAPV